MDEIKSSYKKKISMYHPDKVNSMGPEFNEIAQQKTKEINSAYDKAMKLKKWLCYNNWGVKFMKSFLIFLVLLVLLITLVVINNTNYDKKNISVLDGSTISQDGSIILKDGEKINPSKK